MCRCKFRHTNFFLLLSPALNPITWPRIQLCRTKKKLTAPPLVASNVIEIWGHINDSNDSCGVILRIRDGEIMLLRRYYKSCCQVWRGQFNCFGRANNGYGATKVELHVFLKIKTIVTTNLKLGQKLRTIVGLYPKRSPQKEERAYCFFLSFSFLFFYSRFFSVFFLCVCVCVWCLFNDLRFFHPG